MNDGLKQVIQKIYERDGEVRSSALVEAAKPKESPAHDSFEWDDKKAGHLHRLTQARTYIRIVKIEIEHRPERLIHVPTINRSETGEGKYVPASVLIHCPDEFDRALTAAMSKLHAARRAVDDLRSAAEKDPKNDRVTMIAQVSKGLEIMEAALQIRH
jgi:hypothetical protein